MGKLIFSKADTSGDGKLSKLEFQAMMQDTVLVEMFERLDMDIDEVYALFEILSSDDGFADYEEFLVGALKMKSSARTFDAIQILHELGTLQKMVSRISKVFHPAPDFGTPSH